MVGRTVVGVEVTGGEVTGGDVAEGDAAGGGPGAGATATGADDTATAAGAPDPDEGVAVVPEPEVPVGAVEPAGVCSTATAVPVSATGSEPTRTPEVTSSSIVVGPPVTGDSALRARAATIDAVAARLIPAVMARDAGATVPDRRRELRPRPTGVASVVIVVLALVAILTLVAFIVATAVVVGASGGGRSGDGRRWSGLPTGDHRGHRGRR